MNNGPATPFARDAALPRNLWEGIQVVLAPWRPLAFLLLPTFTPSDSVAAKRPSVERLSKHTYTANPVINQSESFDLCGKACPPSAPSTRK